MRARPRRRAVLTLAAMLAGLSIPCEAIVLDIAGNVSLTINSVTSIGGGLASATDTTTYSIVNVLGTKKLVGRLNAAMPANVTLSLRATAAVGATSAGPVVLTASDQNLVTGIGIVTQAGLTLTFTLSATVQAGTITANSRTLTLTLVDAP